MGVRQMPYQKGNGKPQYAGMGIGGSGSGGGSSYVLPKASADTLGGIKVGSRLSIDSDGVLSASDQSYSLPTASSEILGGVKVGLGLSISDGVLSATGASKSDIATLQLIGTINSTGSTITAGTYFYLNGMFVKAKTDIVDGDIFIINTNYENAVVGNVLSQLNSNSGGQPIYSPNEDQVTWWLEVRNGSLMKKPVYKKTFSSSFDSTGGEIAVGQLNNVEKIISLSGVTTHSNGNALPCPYYIIAQNWAVVEYHVSDETLYFNGQSVSAAFSFTGITCDVEWTKSTDSWQAV